MNGSSDNIGHSGRKLTLEERIEEHLRLATGDALLSNDYVNSADRHNVRHRALLSALLDACFEHGSPVNGTDSVEIEVGQEPSIWSKLAEVRLAFNLDAKLLNNGDKAEHCLRPIPKESIIPTNIIRANRELLIIWLVAIEVWDKKRDGNHFKTHQAIYNKAAEACGTAASSYKTGRSEMKKSIDVGVGRFSTEEQEFYQSLILFCETKSASAAKNERDSAFSLLLPAALARSKYRAPTELSANKLKG